MLTKPKQPQKEQPLDGSIIFSATICTIIMIIIFVNIYSAYKAGKMYDEKQTEYDVQVANHSAALLQYQKETINHINSIDSNYRINPNGDIPVLISVDCVEDKKSKSVGSDLSFSFSVNNKRVSRNGTLELNISLCDDILFASEIRENDPSSDDVGTEENSVSISFLELNDGVNYAHTVRVKELYGREAGNVAIYNVTYHIKAKKHLNLTSSQKNLFPLYPSFPQKPIRKDFNIGFWEAILYHSDIDVGIVFIVIAGLGSVLLYCIHKNTIYNNKIKKYQNELNAYNAEKDAFIQSLAGKSIRELAGVPKNVFFTENNLPYTKDSDDKYGKYTLYYTPTGSCFHTNKECPRAARVISTNIVTRPKRLKPCSKCAKGFDTSLPSWYFSYKEIKKKIESYEITEYIP